MLFLIGFQLLTLCAGWSLSAVIFSLSPRSFPLPVCLSFAAISFLSPQRFHFPCFTYFSTVKWLVFTSSLSSAFGTVPHSQFLNLSLLWSALSAVHQALSLSVPLLVFLLLHWLSFTQSAELKGPYVIVFNISPAQIGATCTMFRVKRVSTCIYGTMYVQRIYYKNPPFNTLMWGLLRLAPISSFHSDYIRNLSSWLMQFMVWLLVQPHQLSRYAGVNFVMHVT